MLDVWRGMVARCHDSRSVSFPYYGAKGILVCDRWRSSFDAFLEDIGTIPKGLSLERIDNAIGYTPGNIRLATIVEQNNHKADTRRLTHDGRTQNMSAWAAEIGISPQCLHYRLVNGWPVAAALTLPKGSAYRPNPRKTGYTYRGVKK